MSIVLIVTLILVGLLLLVLEILVIPGIVVGVIGFLTVVGSIMAAYSYHGNVVGHITLFSTVILSIFIFVYMFKSKTWSKMALEHNIDSKVNTIDIEIKPGDQGITVSRLAPMGKARFENEIIEVSAQGEFIDQNTDITVIRIEENKVFVKVK